MFFGIEICHKPRRSDHDLDDLDLEGRYIPDPYDLHDLDHVAWWDLYGLFDLDHIAG